MREGDVHDGRVEHDHQLGDQDDHAIPAAAAGVRRQLGGQGVFGGGVRGGARDMVVSPVLAGWAEVQ